MLQSYAGQPASRLSAMADDDADYRPKEAVLGLSERETAVARLAAAGYSNKAIAGRLNLTEATVKVYLKAVFAALDIRCRTALLRYFGPQVATGNNYQPTDLERQILAVLIQGGTNDAIAATVGRAVALIKSDMRALVTKTQTTNRTRLASWWLVRSGVAKEPVDIIPTQGMSYDNLERLRRLIGEGVPDKEICQRLGVRREALMDGMRLLLGGAR